MLLSFYTDLATMSLIWICLKSWDLPCLLLLRLSSSDVLIIPFNRFDKLILYRLELATIFVFNSFFTFPKQAHCMQFLTKLLVDKLRSVSGSCIK
jgi:hypothetical protein